MFPSKLMLCVEDPAKPVATVDVARLSKRLGASLLLFHSRRPGWDDVKAVEVDVQKSKEAELMRALVRDPAMAGGKVEVLTTASPLDLVDAMLDAATSNGVDLLVLPTHGRSGVDRLVFGSVTERAVRSCRVPVMTFDLERLAHVDGADRFDSILVPVDFSAISEKTVPVALALAQRFACPVHLLHVIEDYYVAAYPMAGVPSVLDFQPGLTEAARQQMARLEHHVAAKARTHLSTSVEVGRMIDQVRDHVALSKNPLIVMATAGRDSLGDWVLGSRAERLIRTSKCSILAIPPTYFGKP